MKSLIVCLTLITSMGAMASEIKVLELTGRNARGTIRTRFEVNLQDATAGVSAKASRIVGGKNRYRVFNTFEAAVAELSMNGKNLEFNKDGQNVVCGTMKISRIFKIPTLKLSGRCNLVTKRLKGKAVVTLIAE